MDRTIAIEEARSLNGLIEGLAELLVDAVDGGASVGFVAPFTPDDAARWWRSVAADIDAGKVILLTAREGDRVVGTVQLRLAPLPNSRHRAEVAKLLVHRDLRGRGIARRLLAALDNVARREGRTLLVLDTISGSEADVLYRSLGWTEVGSVPNYAAMPDGSLAPTTIFYREL
ncbi:MAG: GNAT family N-acetyltransferase [Chloroflexi bacterium]|nr:MAG: GNAT family N-acetyltransferase [Chloroflexota bacterium]